MTMPIKRRIAVALEFHLLYKQHAECFAGILRYADEQGWETIIDEWVEVTLDNAGPGPLPYDGVIARINDISLDLVDVAAKRDIPLVNVHRSSPVYERVPGVFPDLEQMGRLRAEHLLSRGLRHFGCFVVRGRHAEELMARGFISAIEDAGYAVNRAELIADWGATIEGHLQGLAIMRQWIDGWTLPIGVAFGTDVFARMIAQMVAERGLQVPDEVAIVGGLNEERICEQPRPSLTSIEAGYDRVGYEAAKMLDQMMQDAEERRKQKAGKKPSRATPARPMHLLLPPVGVVVRESTDFIAVDDKLVANAMAYIAEKCHFHLEAEDVAEAVGVSPRTLHSRFKTVMNSSVARELRRVRIEKVKRELTSSSRPIEEIAQSAGFASRTHMHDVFKRDVGVTPGAYRKKRKIESSLKNIDLTPRP